MGVGIEEFLAATGLKLGRADVIAIASMPSHIDLNGGSLESVIESLEVAVETDVPFVYLTHGYDSNGWGIAVNGVPVTRQPHWVFAVAIGTINLHIAEIREGK